MARHTKYSLCLILIMTAAMLFRTERASAQEILMPESWRRALYDVPPLYKADTLTICFMGDIMMHTRQIETARKKDGTYDFSSYFMLIEDRISSADLAVANMEFTLAGEPYSGYPCFSAPDGFEDYLADTGFDIFLAANNHIFDKGSEGAARTIEAYRKLEKDKGIRFAGIASDKEMLESGTPLTIIRKGIRLSFINFTYGTNLGGQEQWPQTNYAREKEKLGTAFAKADSADADFTIVLPHWGPEYRLIHSQEQEETAYWLARNGADFIIGAHPHVVQDTMTIEGVPVVYSLGNAVSNMSAANTQLELMVTLRIIRHGNGDLTTEPLEYTWLWCSRPGGFNSSYTVIPVEEYIGREDEWQDHRDYRKMTYTYRHVKETTRITDTE